MGNDRDKARRRPWELALAACILALLATGAIGGAAVLLANGGIGIRPDTVGGCIQFNQRVEVLAVDAREETMRVRVLPWDDGITVSTGTLSAGEEGTVDYSGACMGGLAPLPGDDLVVSWVGLVDAESSFPLEVEVVSTTFAFRNEIDSLAAAPGRTGNGQSSPSQDGGSAASPSSDAADSDMATGGVFACDAIVEVTGYDEDSATVCVRTLPAGQTDLDGGPLSMPAGTEGAIVISPMNWRYGHAPDVKDRLVVSWIGTEAELPAKPASIRTAGDFWYETGRAWPDAWIEASSTGALTRQMVASTPLEDLMEAEGLREGADAIPE